MPAFITFESVTYRAPDGRDLLQGLTLAFGRERTGLVGRNGLGKTSLLRLILGDLAPTHGTVAVTGRVAHLRQTPLLAGGAQIVDVIGAREGLDRLARLERGGAPWATSTRPTGCCRSASTRRWTKPAWPASTWIARPPR